MRIFLLVSAFLSILLSAFHAAADTPEKLEIRVAPLALLARWYTLETAYKISKTFDLGINYTHFGARVEYRTGNMFFPTLSGDSYGLNLNYYFFQVPTGSSAYASMKLNREVFQSIGHASPSIYSYDGMSATLLGGRRFSLAELIPGLGILLGGGAKFYIYDQKESKNTLGVISKDHGRRQGALPIVEAKLIYTF